MFEADGVTSFSKLNNDGSKQTPDVSISYEQAYGWNIAIWSEGLELYFAASNSTDRPPLDGWDVSESGVEPLPQLRYFQTTTIHQEDVTSIPSIARANTLAALSLTLVLYQLVRDL